METTALSLRILAVSQGQDSICMGMVRKPRIVGRLNQDGDIHQLNHRFIKIDDTVDKTQDCLVKEVLPVFELAMGDA